MGSDLSWCPELGRNNPSAEQVFSLDKELILVNNDSRQGHPPHDEGTKEVRVEP